MPPPVKRAAPGASELGSAAEAATRGSVPILAFLRCDASNDASNLEVGEGKVLLGTAWSTTRSVLGVEPAIAQESIV